MTTLPLREVSVPRAERAVTYFTHPHALVETPYIGEGTRVWAFAHVMAGAVVGAHCNLGDHCFIESGAHVGDRVTVKNGVAVWRGVHIDNDAFIGPGVVFTNDRRPRAFIRVPEGELLTTRVGRGATLGARATLLCGLEIGEYAFIAASTTVTRDVPGHALMMGTPARQRGWVCRCAHQLEAAGAGRWFCPVCDLHYRADGYSLVHLPKPSDR